MEMDGSPKLYQDAKNKIPSEGLQKIDPRTKVFAPQNKAGGVIQKDAINTGEGAVKQFGGQLPQNNNHNNNVKKQLKDKHEDEDDFSFPIPQQLTVEKCTYSVHHRLGKGGFGQVFLGRQVNGRAASLPKEDIALKLEHKTSKGCQNGEAPYEWQVYDQLGKVEGIPRIYHKGLCNNFYVMAMELLGPSLWDQWNKNGQRITEAHAACFAIESIAILRRMHDKGFVHGDIKPENFLMGASGTVKEKKLYLVDLGLATQWREANGAHVAYDQRPDDFRGTVRYASVHSHLGRRLSRRDDLESLVYTILFLIKGRLPWQGFGGDNKSFQVARKKVQTSTDALCKGLAPAFKEFAEMIFSLKFEEKPDYDACMCMFVSIVPTEQTLCQIQLSDGCNQVTNLRQRTRGEIDGASNTSTQRKKTRHGGAGAKQWVSVYNSCAPMKQRYHYNVGTQRLENLDQLMSSLPVRHHR
eukprot:TRINITY_DN4228_c0_g2_i1.p1 TRINITY_DN4228_c0_g2~~TRINITY_DN4228_c0_g2_i1.p1  ORF type:complete len:468 (-),score=52.37 TRINITY_DN4228_c0_g2_i1:66-1469(-)